jgi:hypothetical protein
MEEKVNVMEEDNSYKLERKMNKLYEKLLDIESKLEQEYYRKRREQIKYEKTRLEDEELSIKQMEYDYRKRESQMDYFNDRY